MNFLRGFALSAVALAAAAAFTGCGGGDGSREVEAGRAALELGDYAKADRLLSRGVELAPENVEALLLAVRTKIALAELDAARELSSKAEALAGDDSDVLQLAAQTAYLLRDYATARAKFMKTADDASLDPKERAAGLTGAAVVDIVENRRHAARTGLLTALRLDRRNAAARYHLGYLYQNVFSYPSAALEQFEMFARLGDPSDPRVRKVQRTTIPGLKDSIARGAAERPGAAKRDSAAAAAAISSAAAAFAKGNFKTARTEYAKALAADPLSHPAALGLARCWEKTDASADGRKKALDCYRTACELDPGAIGAFISAGALASGLGQHAVAVEIYSRALAADPANVKALDGLVAAMGRKGGGADVRDAISSYKAYRNVLTAGRRR